MLHSLIFISTYGPLIARAVNADFFVEAWSGKGMVRNYGDPNITSVDPFPKYYPYTLATEWTQKWDFYAWVPDVIVINLGTNDYSTQPHPPQNVFETGIDYDKILKYFLLTRTELAQVTKIS